MSPPPHALTTSYRPADTSAPLAELTVGALLAQRARERPDALALVGNQHGDGAQVRLTYRELEREAQAVATALSRLAAPGEHVALWAPNVVEWPLLEHGAALAGVVLAALNPVLRAHELEQHLRHSRSTVLIHADRSRDYDMAAVVREVSARMPGLRTVSLSEREVWRADEVDAAVVAAAPTDPDAVVMLQYTSGTTGRPKGVLLRHRSLVNVARFTMEHVGVAEGAVAVNPLPMFHTAACVIGTLGPLWVGGTSLLVEQFVPAPVLQLARDEGASVLFYVPAVLHALLEAQRVSDLPAPRLDRVVGGASNVPAALIEDAERVFGARVINMFGQTELAPVLTATRPDDARDDQLTTVGSPLPQVECKVVDPETGETVPLGVVGEVCARGYQQLVGYLDDPEATAAAVDAEGFVHTGDLGQMDERGYLRLVGRLKELIIRGGENIAPAEVETSLAELPDVLEAAVVGLPDERLGEVVAAVLRLRDASDPGVRERLVQHARTRLSPHKVPVRWFVTEALPLTPTGKVQKFALVDLVGSGGLPELTPTP